MLYDVFFSHRNTRKDEIAPLVQALKHAKQELFLDSDRIGLGDDITDTLWNGLLDSRVLIAWMTPDYFDSEPCQWELTSAVLSAPALYLARHLILLTPTGAREEVFPPHLTHQISAWSQAEALADPAAFATKVAAQVGQTTRRFRDGDAGPPRFDVGANSFRNSRFVGRMEELWRIDAALSKHFHCGVVSLGKKLAVTHGLGGIGKSALAAEYARRFMVRYPGGIVRLSVGGDARDGDDGPLPPEERIPLAALRALRQAAQDLGLSVIEPNDPDAARAAYRGAIGQTLGNDLPYLWMIDDLPSRWSRDDFERHLTPPTPAGRCLITRRGRSFASPEDTIYLDRLPPADALRLLRRACPSGDEALLSAIAEHLGGHALALTLAAAALEREPSQAQRYLSALTHSGVATLDGLAPFLDELDPHHRQGVLRCFAYSLDLVPRGGQAETLLTILSQLAPAPVPTDFLAQILAAHLLMAEPPLISQPLLALERLGLIQTEDGAVSLHGLLADAVTRRIPPPAFEVLSIRTDAWDLMAGKLKAVRNAPARRVELDPLWPHINQLATRFHDANVAEPISLVADLHAALGDVRDTLPLRQRLFDWYHAKLGVTHRLTLQAMNSLGEALLHAGDARSAKPLQEQALALLRQFCGREDLDTLVAMNNLASALWALGDYAGAKALHQQTLAIQRRVLRPEHPHTLTSMTNLGLTLQALGDAAGAKALQESALEAQRRVLGPEHPDTLQSMHNLANTLEALGDTASTKGLREQTFAILRRVLGPEHPHTLTSMNNLAGTLEALGDLAGAKDLYEQTLALRRRVLGPEHPDTLASMNNLAYTLIALNDLTPARALAAEALPVARRILPDQHPYRSALEELQAELHPRGAAMSAAPQAVAAPTSASDPEPTWMRVLRESRRPQA